MMLFELTLSSSEMSSPSSRLPSFPRPSTPSPTGGPAAGGLVARTDLVHHLAVSLNLQHRQQVISRAREAANLKLAV